ncbi:MAG: tripartite tricarboxylate transporter permease [Desulfobacterales bacterium]|nr:tripartite tricarboxylate transporter permease [Desulfobacterales bacterium]
MIEAFIQGLWSYADPQALGFLIVGTCIGIFIGLLPAVGGLVAMAILLPMVFGMQRVAGISMLLAIAAINTTGGSITAILMNIPGSGPSTATLLDGFPMTQRGEAGRAFGAMLCSATMGSLLGVFLAVVMIPIVRPVVLTFSSAELFFLIVMGISFLAVLGRGAAVKGLIAGLLGILIAMIGYQHSTGVDRFGFGNMFLLQGLSLVPVVLGLFAGAELLDLAVSGKSIVDPSLAKTGKDLRRQILMGMKEVFQYPWLWFRCCVLGYVIGLIPGIGGDTAVFVAYAQAKQTSRHPEKFGTGIIEGIIAPEAASNAKEGGALLTTMLLGLPGSASMALLMGALLLQGVIPGPNMLDTELELTFTLLWGLALANVIGGILCYLIAGYLNLTAIVTLAPRYLIPGILTLVYVGAFVYDKKMGDVVVAFVFTLIGIVMKKYDYNRPSMLLGFILGVYFEEYFWLSLQTRGPLFFMRPACLVIIAITLSLYAVDLIRTLSARRAKRRLAA